MFTGVGATLPASDLERAKAWYADKLGVKPSKEDFNGAWYDVGDTAFLLYESAFAGTNQATAAAFVVEDIDEAVSTLRGRGVTFETFDLGEEFTWDNEILTGPDGTQAAWFKDTEGNILSVGTM